MWFSLSHFSCPLLHRTAGDTERRYHLRYYKTCTCVYETDARGHCVKNGAHCAFAHGAQDLRPPSYDVRELQALENAERQGSSITDSPLGSSLEKDRIINEDPRWNGELVFVWHSVCVFKILLLPVPNEWCRYILFISIHFKPKREFKMCWNHSFLSPLNYNDLVVYTEDNLQTLLCLHLCLLIMLIQLLDTNYVLANYKTEQCKRPPRLCRQGYACPSYHNTRDRRRSPKKFKYR